LVSAAFSGFEYLLKRIGENNALGTAISQHILHLTRAVVASVPLTNVNASQHIYTLNQVQVQGWACKLRNSECTKTVVSLFDTYKNTSVRPNKNLRSIVYCYGLKNSKNVSVDWNFLWNAFLSSKLSTEQVTILAALGCTSDQATLNGFLNKTLKDNSGIRPQDYAAVFSAVYGGSIQGVDVALDFFISNYNAIVSRYTSMNSVGKIIKGIADQINTVAQIEKLQNFTKKLDGTILDIANSALTSAQNNYQWAKTYNSSLNDYFIAPVTTPVPTTPTTKPPSSAYQNLMSLCLIAMGLFVIIL